MRAVLDTNVLVSALLTPTGTAARAVAHAAAAGMVVIADRRILAEYVDVLARPRFKFPPRVVEVLLQLFVAMPRPPSLALAWPDPDDAPFLELASAHRCPLVTGNIKHYPIEGHAGIVLTPAQFLASL